MSRRVNHATTQSEVITLQLKGNDVFIHDGPDDTPEMTKQIMRGMNSKKLIKEHEGLQIVTNSAGLNLAYVDTALL